SLGVLGIAARLDDRFALLTSGSRTALPRQQTMHAAVDWSYDLLSQSERVVLSRLAVFVGAFTLQAASEVASGADISAREVGDCVANLVAKSLLSADVAAPIVHYCFLETTRAYAHEKLVASGELEQLERRHAEYHRHLFERAEAESETRPTAEWLAGGRPPIDNPRAGPDWGLWARGDPAPGAGLPPAPPPLV